MLSVKLSATILLKKHGKIPFFCQIICYNFVEKARKKSMLSVKLSATVLWKKHGKNPCFCGKSMEKIHAFVEKARKKSMLSVKLSATVSWKKHGKNPCFCGKSTEKIHAFVEKARKKFMLFVKFIIYISIIIFVGKAWKKSLLFPCFLYKILKYNLPCFCGKSMEYFRKNHGFWLSWKNHGICGNPWIFLHKFSMDFLWILHALNTRGGKEDKKLGIE